MCSTCNLVKEKAQIYLKWMKNVKMQQHIVKIVYMGILCIKRNKYATVCAELPFAKVTFDRMVMIFIEYVIFALFAMNVDYCNIQRVCEQR